MTTDIKVRADLTAEIIAAHQAAFAAANDAVQHAVHCGELLLKAKAEVKHGDFGAYCKTLPFGDRMAQRYMHAAIWAKSNPTRVSDMGSLRGLLTMAEQDSPKKSKSKTTKTTTLKTKAQRQFAAVADDKGKAAAVLQDGAPRTPSEAHQAALMAESVIRNTAAQLPKPDRIGLLHKVILDLGLAAEIKSQLEDLIAEGKKNAATFSPIAVAHRAHTLKKLLGFVPPGVSLPQDVIDADTAGEAVSKAPPDAPVEHKPRKPRTVGDVVAADKKARRPGSPKVPVQDLSRDFAQAAQQ